MQDVQITLLDRWEPALAGEFSRFYGEKNSDTPWQGRWDFSARQYAWKFILPPAGPSALAIARQDETIVGACSINFRNLQGLGTKLRVGEIADLAVAPDWRGKGLFADLVRRVTTHVLAQGADGVYCLPNSQGARALIRTGLYETAAQSAQATWLVPLQPAALLATRYSIFTKLAGLDTAWKAMMRLRRAPDHDHRAIAELAAGPVPPQAADLLRVSLNSEYLRYRTVQYPIPDAYRVLVADTGGVIVRDVMYQKHRALIGARTLFADLRGFRSCIAMLRAEALGGNCAFAALWAPWRRPYKTALLLAGYLPVQRKDFIVAKDSSAAFLRHIGSLHLDMLDSDKI